MKPLALALVALPLQAQVRVEVIAENESQPVVLALRGAVLASRSFVMDRDTTHVRFWVFVHPGGAVRCGTHTIKSVSVVVQRVGPNWRSGDQRIVVDAYAVGTESDQARKLLALIEQATGGP
jgi:hypothetical protein